MRLRCQWVKHLKTMSLNNMEIESLRKYAAKSGEIFIREEKARRKKILKGTYYRSTLAMLDMESFMETQSLSEIKDEDVLGKCGMCGQPRDETVSHEHYCIRLI